MHVRSLALLIAAAGVPLAAARAQTTVSSAQPVTVTVHTPGHDFHPQVIKMPSGVPVRLVLDNPSGTDHDFYAPDFFAAAQVNDADRGMVQDGRVEIHKYDTRSVRLIARPGHYDLKSTKALDVASGMQGQILVY